MDGAGNVREGTHFLFSTTPEGHLVAEGGRVQRLGWWGYGRAEWLQQRVDITS